MLYWITSGQHCSSDTKNCHKHLNFYNEKYYAMIQHKFNSFKYWNLTFRLQLCFSAACVQTSKWYYQSKFSNFRQLNIPCVTWKKHTWFSHMTILSVLFNSTMRVQLAFSKRGLCFGVWHRTMTFLCSHTEVGERVNQQWRWAMEGLYSQQARFVQSSPIAMVD